MLNFWALGKNKNIFFINHVQFGPCLGNLILKNKLSIPEELNGKENNSHYDGKINLASNNENHKDLSNGSFDVEESFN